jgi:DGQHR domain-containing protein
MAAIPGRWLLGHSTPSWRIKDPIKGFQRLVREERAKEIAVAVLDQGRSFPNGIVLAASASDIPFDDTHLKLPSSIKFFIVDGQHRLWAQNFSAQDATFGCFVHFGLSKVEMARLFLEINDNQKRVPSSLRWDLVRLVRPQDDLQAIEAAELVYALASNEKSPLFQRIDLTGEQGEIDLKQASLAPEFKSLISSRRPLVKAMDFEDHYEALVRFFTAVRSVDREGWRSGESPLVKARVLRALIRTIPDIASKKRKSPHEIPTAEYAALIGKIDRRALAPENIRAMQGSAGIKEIQDTVKTQMDLDG